MHSLLNKLLKKRGVNKITDLHKEERETFDKWHKILSEGDITVDKIKKFCENQINLISKQ